MSWHSEERRLSASRTARERRDDTKVVVKGERRSELNGNTPIDLPVVFAILGLLVALAAARVIKYLGSAKTDTARIQADRPRRLMRGTAAT